VAGPIAPAYATVTIRQDVDRTGETRPDAKDPLFISYDDCATDNGLEFTLDLAQPIMSGETLAIWVSESADCSDPMNRTNGMCDLVTTQADLEPVMTVELLPKDIVAPLLGIDGCELESSNTQPRKAAIYFLRYLTADEQATGAVWDQTSVDLLGPQPPVDIKAGVGEGRLVLSYSPEGDEADRVGYAFFCDDGTAQPAGTGGGGGSGTGGGGGSGTGGGGGSGTGGGGGSGTGGGGGSGTGGGGGSGTGGVGATGGSNGSSASACDDNDPGACESAVLIAGERPDVAYQCGSSTGFEGEAKPLGNEVCYRVGIAGYDRVGNVGKLSSLVCEAPQNVDDFFEVYREAGGQAGGGFCSCRVLGLAGGGGIGAAGGLAAAALGLGLRRVRRGRKAQESAR
jgi:hypothetical protein